MKKRILSIFLIVCLCAAFLPSFAAAEGEWSEYLWICGTQVTSANASNIKSGVSSGTVSYNRDNHTLTLDNAKISTTEKNAIVISEGFQVFSSRLTINLIGKNTIYVKDTRAAIYSSPNGNFQGLTLSGTGSLEINCEECDNLDTVNGIGLYGGGYGAPKEGSALIIDGVSLKITTGAIESMDSSCKNFGIDLSGTRGADLWITNGAQVTVTAGAAKSSKSDGAGAGSYGISVCNIHVEGANTKLIATAGDAEGSASTSSGIYIAGNADDSGMLTVTGGASVTATGGKATTSYGVYLKEKEKSGITVDNASLLAQTTQDAGEDVVLGALNKAPDLTFTSGYDWRTAASGAFTRSTTTEYAYDAKQTYVAVKPAEPEEEPDEQPDGVGGLVAILDDIPFVDVDFNDYYYDSVKWAYHSGVTGGTDAWHFSPDAGCTRAQAVTFLWRAAGCPTAAYLGNFSDVDADAYYAPAVAWAVANGVTNGTSATTFSPEAACSRGDIVTFLFRAFGGASNGYHPFSDVPANAYYADAVAWAYEHGVTGGTGAEKFSPADACSRAQIVTFLYRVLG